MHALELPEILARVGFFLPLWVAPSGSNDHRPRVCRPHTIHACILVCKFWYQTLTPLLWYVYDGAYFDKVPLELIRRHSHLIRSFKAHLAHQEGYFQCTNLVDLRISDVSSQWDLVRLNHGLRNLYWHGKLLAHPLDVESLTQFTRMKEMTLLSWDGSKGRLAEVLRSVARTLTKLGLYSICGVRPGDFMVLSDEGQGRVQLVLPHLLKLSYRINHAESTRLEDLVVCCPNLYKLSVILEGNYDLARLTENIRKHCPKVRALTLKYLSYTELEYEQLLQSCQTSGLVKFRANLAGFGGRIISAINAHASTLTQLKLEACNFIHLDINFLLEILVQCWNLKIFNAFGLFKASREEILNGLWSKPWGCSQLQVLCLEFHPDQGVPDPEHLLDAESDREGGYADKGEGEGENGKAIPMAIEGWYLHPQHSTMHDIMARRRNMLFLTTFLRNLAGMKHLEMFRWSQIKYERSATPKYC
ncbi:hypothetical protein EDD21DRAFT_366279, partial [Dissophora ornata]